MRRGEEFGFKEQLLVMRPPSLSYCGLKRALPFASLLLLSVRGEAQIQIDLKLRRFQYIAYEPIVATLTITNLAGRTVELRSADGQPWLGFEVTGTEDQPVPQSITDQAPLPLKIEAGRLAIRKINLASLYPVHDFGAYHVRAHIYFADLGKFFYSPKKVFEVTGARPVWQRTVGIPQDAPGPGKTRTYSLLTNRFPDHTSLYVRVEDKESGIVYATYSLGRSIAFKEPQAEFDVANQLHVLHCAAPRSWSYSRVGLNGELLTHSRFAETKTQPRLRHAPDGRIIVTGGTIEAALTGSESRHAAPPKPSERPANMLKKY
jgi:hypothetical protein